uniref:hypothetical protein n=1 Tax=Sulfitobacter sp. TaxID=1903071 RepID=UPI003F6B8D67
TAPLRKLQNDDPVALMEMYRDIATTGVFNPKHGRPVPAVTNLPPGDEPLARSLEYSIATAAARLQSSRERGRMNAAMFGALLHKSGEGLSSPYPRRTYPTGSVIGIPRAV